MDRNEQRNEVELTVDLGSITDETKGPGVQGNDFIGQMTLAGLSDN